MKQLIAVVGITALLATFVSVDGGSPLSSKADAAQGGNGGGKGGGNGGGGNGGGGNGGGATAVAAATAVLPVTVEGKVLRREAKASPPARSMQQTRATPLPHMQPRQIPCTPVLLVH